MAFVSLWCTTDLPCKFLKNRAHVVFGLSQNWMNFRTTIFGLDNSQYSGMTWPCLICIIARNQHRKCCLFPGGADLAVSVRKKKERKRKRKKKRKKRTKWASPIFYYVASSPPPLSLAAPCPSAPLSDDEDIPSLHTGALFPCRRWHPERRRRSSYSVDSFYSIHRCAIFGVVTGTVVLLR